MKTRNVVTTVMIATALFVQSAFASSHVGTQGVITREATQAVPAASKETVVKVNEVAGAAETYAELLQRIKQDSLRELTDKLDTRELIGEAISSTVRSLMDAMLSSKPQL